MFGTQPFVHNVVFTWPKKATELRSLALDGRGLLVQVREHCARALTLDRAQSDDGRATQFDADNELLSDGVTTIANASAASCFDAAIAPAAVHVRGDVAVVFQSVVPPCVTLFSLKDGRVVDVAPSSKRSVPLVDASGAFLQFGAHSLTVQKLATDGSKSLSSSNLPVKLFVPVASLMR